MFDRIMDETPRLLMVCHCLPTRNGDCRRKRAWQLLTAAARTHRVWLTLIADGPVHFHQWRALDDCTESLAVVGHLSLRPRHQAARQTRKWLEDYPFHAAICSSPQLWLAIRKARLAIKVCDFSSPDSMLGRSRKAQRIERAVAEDCDIALSDQHGDQPRFTNLGAKVHLMTEKHGEKLVHLLDQAISADPLTLAHTDAMPRLVQRAA
jgi:hypothetical protein